MALNPKLTPPPPLTKKNYYFFVTKNRIVIPAISFCLQLTCVKLEILAWNFDIYKYAPIYFLQHTNILCKMRRGVFFLLTTYCVCNKWMWAHYSLRTTVTFKENRFSQPSSHSIRRTTYFRRGFVGTGVAICLFILPWIRPNVHSASSKGPKTYKHVTMLSNTISKVHKSCFINPTKKWIG